MESTATYGTVVLEEKKKHPKTSWRTPTRAGNEKKPTCQRVGGETQSTTNRFHLPKATHHPEETQNAELFPEAKGLKPMWGTSNVKTCAWETSPQTSCFERQWCSYPRDPQDHSANEGKAHAFGLTAPGLLRRSSRLDFPWQVAYFLVFRWWWRPAGLASQSNTHLDACWNTLWDSRWRAPFSRPSAASRQAEIPRESGLYLLAALGFPPGFCVCAKGGGASTSRGASGLQGFPICGLCRTGTNGERFLNQLLPLGHSKRSPVFQWKNYSCARSETVQPGN